MNYSHCINNIKTACKLIEKVGGNHVMHADGRIVSAMDEQGILTLLANKLLEMSPETRITIPKHRHWFDIMIDGIPINLKLTTGGTDNAFNKNAILFSLTGHIHNEICGNFDNLLSKLHVHKLKLDRNQLTEYHYLVINKVSGEFLLKSIFDIHTYASNPCNILQINWKKEFANMDYETPPDKYKDKVTQLLTTIQTSIRTDIECKRKFAELDCSTLFNDGIK